MIHSSSFELCAPMLEIVQEYIYHHLLPLICPHTQTGPAEL